MYCVLMKEYRIKCLVCCIFTQYTLMWFALAYLLYLKTKRRTAKKKSIVEQACLEWSAVSSMSSHCRLLETDKARSRSARVFFSFFLCDIMRNHRCCVQRASAKYEGQFFTSHSWVFLQMCCRLISSHSKRLTCSTLHCNMANKLISEWPLSFISQHNNGWMCFQWL